MFRCGKARLWELLAWLHSYFFDRALKAMLGIQVCGQQSSLKPRARCCFAAAKLDFGSCLLGSIPHTSVKLNCQKHGGFQVDGWTWDIASFAVLSRIFRGSFAKFGCQKWQVQILNLNWALATCSLQRTLQPELRHPTPTAETQGFHYTSCVNFPLVHSHWTKQTIWNILNFSFATFREANLLSRSFATQHFSFAKVM